MSLPHPVSDASLTFMISSSADLGPDAFEATVCIIGAGAAGITTACELDDLGVRVLLLEAGGMAPDGELAGDIYAGTAVSPHPAPVEFRRTGVGGTTRIWGGRCVPFDPIDFERRDHVPHSGWPIRYEDVARHYSKALEYCNAGRDDFSIEGSGVEGVPTIPGLAADDPVVMDRIERYSLPTNFGREYRGRLKRSKHVQVVFDARCTRLHRRPGEDTIDHAVFISRADRRFEVRAKIFVLALGGIETTRLLFVSEPRANGLGNRGDRLGRCYACHGENVCARLVAAPGAPVAFGFEKTNDGVYSRRKLQFTAQAQREHRLLNAAFRLHFPDYSDAAHGSAVMSTIFLAKSTLIPEYQAILRHGAEAPVVSSRGEHLLNVARGLPPLARFGTTWLFRRVLPRRKLPYTLIANADGSYPLEFNSEQTPLESSRITLADTRDRHDLPRVHIDWRVAGDDIAAGLRAFAVLRDAIARTGSARVEFDEEELAASIRRSVPVGGHHLGTARMADGEGEGVVDGDCAVFGVRNLYVASAATFPTSSHANPTLTIVALAIRLAALLRKRLAEGPEHFGTIAIREDPRGAPK